MRRGTSCIYYSGVAKSDFTYATLPVSLWKKTPLIQPQYEEAAEATGKPKPKPEVKRKPVRKPLLQPLSGGGTVGELGKG